MLNTPVALLFYRRPELLQRVFEQVAQAQPRQLLLIADGPRDPSEDAVCAQTRAVVEHIDWPCEVQRLYADRNMGLRTRVSSGLDWVFSRVDRAIIIEDDCLPHQSFFPFASELLERYQDDERVFGVAGANHQFGRRRSAHSYYFSAYPGIWGWATWRRAWQHYDVNMTGWRAHVDKVLAATCATDRERRYWRWVFESVEQGVFDTWDYQFTLAMWQQHGLFAIPEVNLVSNVGFGTQGTHTRNKRSRLANVPALRLGDVDHPPNVFRNQLADLHTSRHVFHVNRPIWLRNIVRSLRAG
jgi:hypothetical protein